MPTLTQVCDSHLVIMGAAVYTMGAAYLVMHMMVCMCGCVIWFVMVYLYGSMVVWKHGDMVHM